MNYSQYNNHSNVNIPFSRSREWPNAHIYHAPTWVSVDLRDGNQSLPIPMNIVQKNELFQCLKKIGFKHIEVGYPSANETEYKFIRNLIETNQVNDISITVLVPCIESHIDRAVECVQGAPNVVFHLYNSTSPIQREIVFKKTPKEVCELAINSVNYLCKRIDKNPGWILQYSPESFTATEPNIARDICKHVIRTWRSWHVSRKMIINLPSTVELTTPNIYADYIEYMKHSVIYGYESQVEMSIHTHNDRGTAVASAELALLAGANRVEGTLFGNGERAGNCDLVTVALNMHTSGIDCNLDFSNLPEIEETYKRCTGLDIPPRHPYAGEFYLTAFSGTHQDAINKCINAKKEDDKWEIPYLPINPKDIGKDFSIRINSQSGKGGVAFILKHFYDVELPTPLLREFSSYVNSKSEEGSLKEISSSDISDLLTEFVDEKYPYNGKTIEDDVNSCALIAENNNINIKSYKEYSLGNNSNAFALTIMGFDDNKWYMAIDNNINRSAIKCLLGYINSEKK